MTASALSPIHVQKHAATPTSSSYPILVDFIVLLLATSYVFSHDSKPMLLLNEVWKERARFERREI
jgi:hypothetical protein